MKRTGLGARFQSFAWRVVGRWQTIAFSLQITAGCARLEDLGVTTGGAEDIASARTTIENGGVPDPDSITVEGFLSEHSIPITAPPAAGLLYATATTAWNQDFDGFTPLATVQIGFGTTLDRETFRRSPLNLGLVIDRSGSMGDPIDPRTGTPKLDAVKVAVDRLLGNLTGDDRVSIITFSNGATVRLEAARGDDTSAIKSALNTFGPEGSTELVDGLRSGYETVRSHHSVNRSDRLFVFTDVLLTQWNEFLLDLFYGVIDQYAEQEIGATFFGVGADFGHHIAYEISQKRGGNYFFLSDYERIVNVFDNEFDFLVTPVAYDVSLEVTIPFEFDMAAVHGIPVSGTLRHAFDLSVPTLFLSSRSGGGAIFLRARVGSLVDFARENTLAQVALSYKTPEGQVVTHPAISASLPAGLNPTAMPEFFQDTASRRGVLLLNTALVLKRACEDYYGDYGYGFYDPTALERAITRLTQFLTFFDSLAVGLEDATSESSRTLSQERALVERLRQNMEAQR